MVINLLNSQDQDFKSQLKDRLNRKNHRLKAVSEQVEAIISDVANNGDQAIIDYTLKFDNHQLSSLAIPPKTVANSLDKIPKELLQSLKLSIERIDRFHQHQKTEDWHFTDKEGVQLAQKTVAIDSVGIYAPGGKACYPSSIIMNAVPAKVAGVKKIILVSPTPNGELNPVLLATAHLLGITEMYPIGGAQAIAALAHGTQSITAVDKITGPGNIYVTEAKRQVFGKVGIDMLAGPSEILILADNSSNAHWLTIDLFAQAEHDELAQAMVISHEQEILNQIEQRITLELEKQPRKLIIKQSLANRGLLIKTSSQEESIKIANQIAPEHLEIATKNAAKIVEKINHSGAIFVGQNTPESFGDYLAGGNHILPTSGNARFSSPLGVYDFQKRSTIISAEQADISKLYSAVQHIAKAEGLSAHAESAMLRLKT